MLNQHIDAVIFDWAGTICDYGSLAPLAAFQQLFANRGIDVSLQQAREPMGTEKKEHIRRMLAMPSIAQQWQQIYHSQATPADLDDLYQQLVPLQIEQINRRTALVPGTVETFKFLAQHHIAIGGNTGYGRLMIGDLVQQVAQQGARFDSIVAADEVIAARPGPGAALLNAVQLGVGSVTRCVKVDDTLPGIEEGINAGMWTVAVALSGNAVGMEFDHWQALSPEEQAELKQTAYTKLSQSGAHYIIDSVADLPSTLSEIAGRIANNELP
ncbi:phosphonoacetaldehyde hydrolase [Ferrimonas aestuarii]|uniref:Phosphonoacetaldehyde hydrolase n=1 Tax=Ferrimonas aestuarii TaxID=2569539 RepID=A0A4V5NWC8_9GAMM|nr:phosphonoacetaldehyde hydrolase [Ferrimonas aestuarii]TKB56634.1 phosphonoacetaldehyde hydrolase [Ferrimonas aestuarii]